MTLTLDQPLVAGYGRLFGPADQGGGDVVSQCLSDDPEIENLTLATLGVTAWGRLNYFRTFYSQPWGERGHGKPLSPRSVQGLSRFLRVCGELVAPLPRKPSLFLSDEGCLELVWEDRDGKAVHLLFGPVALACFVERTETESQVAYQPDRLRSLAALLPK